MDKAGIALRKLDLDVDTLAPPTTTEIDELAERSQSLEQRVSSLNESYETLKKRETGALIAADKVRGTDIYSRQGDNLGEVESIMIDKRSGQVAYAVVTFGGFLGIGTERRARESRGLSE